MKLIVPDYYPDFRCIADRCTHTCCAGWEIDIDPAALERYRSIGGQFGERLRQCISLSGDPHFITAGEDERCPFLNERGLCDIIIALGEDALCDICADHPRWRNFYECRTEMGLGLCCESACRLILCRTGIPKLVTLSDDGIGGDSDDEMHFFALRDEIFRDIGDPLFTLSGLCGAIARHFGSILPEMRANDIRGLFEPLEYMGDNLSLMMTSGNSSIDELFAGNEIIARQLLAYFLYRHLPDGMYDGTLAQRAILAVISTIAVGMIARESGDLLDAARLYSSEIEYSDENVTALLKKLG